jgi:hypothetical protein
MNVKASDVHQIAKNNSVSSTGVRLSTLVANKKIKVFPYNISFI